MAAWLAAGREVLTTLQTDKNGVGALPGPCV